MVMKAFFKRSCLRWNFFRGRNKVLRHSFDERMCNFLFNFVTGMNYHSKYILTIFFKVHLNGPILRRKTPFHTTTGSFSGKEKAKQKRNRN